MKNSHFLKRQSVLESSAKVEKQKQINFIFNFDPKNVANHNFSKIGGQFEKLILLEMALTCIMTYKISSVVQMT